jgi:transcriptional regulator with XRE-family HTH domain
MFMQKSRTNMQVGQKIKRIRELRNFTQEYLASRLNITQESYSKIEANKTNVSTQRLEQIAKILEVNIVDLMTFDDKFVFNNFNNAVNAIQTSPNENGKVIFFNQAESERLLYERLIEELKKQVERLEKDNDFLKSLLKHEPK